jgi:hypothetical protein
LYRKASAVTVLSGLSLFAAATAAGQQESVLYGDSFLLSGRVDGAEAGSVVIVQARPHGRSSYGEVGRVRIDARGRWQYRARPAIRTLYRARIGTLLSTPVTVAVEPRIRLRLSGGRFFASVRAARSFAGKFVVLQQRSGGPWQNVRRLVLGAGSATTFRYTAAGRRLEIRLVMPPSQVGPGYVAARSGLFRLNRR